MRAPPYRDIVNASLKGVDKASRKYHKWNGQWLDKAPEGFIQTEIANSLSKICSYITLEDTVDNILDGASAEKKGPKPRGSGSGRVDIIVGWKTSAPRILIEVKNKAWGTGALTKDAIRLRQLLNRGRDGSLRNGKGFLVAFTTARKPKTIERKFEILAGSSKTALVDRIGPKKMKYDDGTVGYWAAGCFSIR